MTNVANSAAILSEQTQRDLGYILETLDQRIHEITSGEPEAGAAEIAALEALRGSTAGMLGADAG